ncbi:hypothetical protein GCM10010403_32020 [Glycomyces rutgersensis]|uniref:Uncharacterized protein n=1 Tax=Glycomyces rutgersensis TaxID=58115 RepID=A0ABN3FTR2_9ACTN
MRFTLARIRGLADRYLCAEAQFPKSTTRPWPESTSPLTPEQDTSSEPTQPTILDRITPPEPSTPTAAPQLKAPPYSTRLGNLYQVRADGRRYSLIPKWAMNPKDWKRFTDLIQERAQ